MENKQNTEADQPANQGGEESVKNQLIESPLLGSTKPQDEISDVESYAEQKRSLRAAMAEFRKKAAARTVEYGGNTGQLKRRICSMLAVD